ncbi:hypothetical protein MUK42_09204 [Musa troglodytarum]|uniref:Uncharacterized protein n=1 Tax=Musa troglodytarum TaxID=320322 RepID=A0A9E7EH67_9LILI|nr:hypothetical protein MUK42_09204 [Musa troglodytarum]
MGPTRVHAAEDGGRPAPVADATIAVDDGVEDDVVGIAVERGKSDVHENPGRPGATVPSEEGDSGIEGRNVGPESTGDEIAEELEGEIAEGGEDQAVAGVVGWGSRNAFGSLSWSSIDHEAFMSCGAAGENDTDVNAMLRAIDKLTSIKTGGDLRASDFDFCSELVAFVAIVFIVCIVWQP